MGSIDKEDFDEAMQNAFVNTIAVSNGVAEEKVRITAILTVNASTTARVRERRFLTPRSAQHRPRRLLELHQQRRQLASSAGIAVEFLIEADSEVEANASARALEVFKTNATILQTRFEQAFTAINNRTVQDHFETVLVKTYAMTVAEVDSAEIVTAPPTHSPTASPTASPTTSPTTAAPTATPTAAAAAAAAATPTTRDSGTADKLVGDNWFETTYMQAKDKVGLGMLLAVLITFCILLGCCFSVMVVKCRKPKSKIMEEDYDEGGKGETKNGKKKLSGSFRPHNRAKAHASGNQGGREEGYADSSDWPTAPADTSGEFESSMRAPVTLDALQRRVQRDYSEDPGAQGGVGGAKDGVIDMTALESKLRVAEAARERALENREKREQRDQQEQEREREKRGGGHERGERKKRREQRKEQLALLEEKKRALLLQYAQAQGICADEVTVSDAANSAQITHSRAGKKSPGLPSPEQSLQLSADGSRLGSRKPFRLDIRGPYAVDGRVDGTPRNLRWQQEARQQQQQQQQQLQPERSQQRQHQRDSRYSAEIDSLETQLCEAQKLQSLVAQQQELRGMLVQHQQQHQQHPHHQQHQHQHQHQQPQPHQHQHAPGWRAVL
jgi:hypothetical protein